MMNDLISIVIPIYNASKYLEKCINSVINQTYKNLEIILVNDGSIDNSLDICNDFKDKDNRIKVISKKNEGVSKTRNIGIDKCKGKYLMFLDSDDYIDEIYVEKMYTYLTKNNLSMVTSSMTLVDVNYNVLKVSSYKDKSDILQVKDIYKDIVNTSYFCPIWKNIIKVSLIKDNSIYFDDSLKFGEDLLFSFKIIQSCEKIGYLSFPGYFYVQNNASITHNNSFDIVKKYVEDNKHVYSILNEYINDDVLITNRLFSKYNFALLKLIKNCKYGEFKHYATLLYKIMFNKDDIIKVCEINYESKSNTILMNILVKKHYFIYYLVAKTYYSIKK